MKSARIDKLGRIVIPMAYRKLLGINEHDELSILRDGNTIVISPLNDVCKLCGNKVDTSRKIQICNECIKRIKAM